MKRVEFLLTMEKIKRFNYGYDRQKIISIDDKDISVEEIFRDEKSVDIIISDFDNNNVLCVCHKNVETEEFTIDFISGLDDDWMIKELENIVYIDINLNKGE